MPSAPRPVAAATVATFATLAIGEHFVELVAGCAAYASAWWLLRESV